MPTQPQAASRSARIESVLTRAFAPVTLDVQDDSARHAGHAGARPPAGKAPRQAGGETHYSVVIVSEAFRYVSRLERSRMVHAALASEFAEGLHALSLTLRAPDEGNP